MLQNPHLPRKSRDDSDKIPTVVFNQPPTGTGGIDGSDMMENNWDRGAGKRSNRRRKKEEEYTDKDRAAAVILWSKDLKHSLLAQKKRQRRVNVNSDLKQTEDLLSAMFFVEANYQMRVKRQTRMALENLDKAIELRPTHRIALATRSHCHLQLGDAYKALKDAEMSLDGQPSFSQGLFQYAEALYNLGHFEKALIAYHNGYRIRKSDGFRIGIQKTEEAILHAIGDCSMIKMEELDRYLSLLSTETGEELAKENSRQSSPVLVNGGSETSEMKLWTKEESSAAARKKMVTKEVLGKIYLDKEYLADFVRRPGVQSGGGVLPKLRSNASEALNYLEIREKFWEQQNPMYARKSRPNMNKKI